MQPYSKNLDQRILEEKKRAIESFDKPYIPKSANERKELENLVNRYFLGMALSGVASVGLVVSSAISLLAIASGAIILNPLLSIALVVSPLALSVLCVYKAVEFSIFHFHANEQLYYG